MRELRINGGSVIVSDNTCAAICDYAVALRRRGTYDHIVVPVAEGGHLRFSDLLIGPTVVLSFTVAADEDVDLGDDLFVSDIRRRTAAALPQDAWPLETSAGGGSSDHSADGWPHYASYLA